MIITIIRTVLLYIFIVFAVRIMGKRQISEMQTSELVVTLIIADIASIPMNDNSQTIFAGFLPTVILVSCEIIASVIMMKKSKFRNLMCGNPVMVIENGVIKQDKMTDLRLTTEDLCVQLRQQGVFSIHDVQYCIVETNGMISVLEKPNKRKPTVEELCLNTDDNGIEVVIINDGELLNNSIKLCKTTEQKVLNYLKKQKVNIEDIFIMTSDCNENFKVIKKQ